MNPPRGALLAFLLLLPLFSTGAVADAKRDWEAGIGIGYLTPRANELSRLYDGGLSFHLAATRKISNPAGSISLEIGYSRSTGNPTAPFFVPSSEAKLQWIPIDLIGRLHLLENGQVVPYLGGGLQIQYTKERFEYTIGEEQRSQSPKERWDPGVRIVAGIDRPLPPRLRIEMYLSMVMAERRLSIGESDLPITGDDDFDAGSIGFRVYWRLP